MAKTEKFPETATVAEVAAFFQVSTKHVIRLCKRGAFPSYKIGGKFNIPVSAAREYYLDHVVLPEKSN